MLSWIYHSWAETVTKGSPRKRLAAHLGLLIEALRVKVCFVRQPCLLFRGVGLLSFLF